MSLDVSLIKEGAKIPVGSGIFIRDGGRTIQMSIEEWNSRYPDRAVEESEREYAECAYQWEEFTDQVYRGNITHNLNKMAMEAGLYEALWRPEEVGIEKGEDLIQILIVGLQLLTREPERFEKFNPDNGWGSYETLVEFVKEYLIACIQYPNAKVEVSR